MSAQTANASPQEQGVSFAELRDAAKFLWPYFRPYRRDLAFGYGALLLKNGAGATMPLIIKAGVDSLVVDFRLSTTLEYCGWMVVAMFIKGFFQFWMRVLLVNVSRDVEFDLRNDIFANLVGLSGGFFGRTRTGDVLARATNDLNAVRMMAGPGVMYWMETVTLAIVVLSIMFTADWRLTLAALLPAPLVSIVVSVLGSRIHTYFQAIQEKFSDISSMVQENLQGVRVVRAYVQEEAEQAAFARLNRDYIFHNLKLAKVSGLFMPLLEFLIGTSFLMVLAVGGWQMMRGEMTVGDYVMFNSFMGLLVWPMIAMGWVVNLTQRGMASLKRIREFLDEKPSIASPQQPETPQSRAGSIEFRNVSYRHEHGFALRGINLQIPAGDTVAIVGPTGSGKSTLAKLIPRLLDPSEGEILVDGVPVDSQALEALRDGIAVVPQETFLFSSSLFENIRFGAPSATTAQALEAAAAAGLESDLESFPEGLDTRVGERGVTLSGGQKQRTAIARALLSDPRILILDDALASVDNITEERILRELETVMRGRTTILISHRVSTIRQAGRIIVLQSGEIVEAGTHDELLARQGYYADLYQRQLLEEELESIS
ncbi:MAG: ABC transporter ATP-binding protein [Bryobacterales bacterium]|nr:ABC transporter ATP-binding protein [Bryobacterales bacterium]